MDYLTGPIDLEFLEEIVHLTTEMDPKYDNYLLTAHADLIMKLKVAKYLIWCPEFQENLKGYYSDQLPLIAQGIRLLEKVLQSDYVHEVHARATKYFPVFCDKIKSAEDYQGTTHETFHFIYQGVGKWTAKGQYVQETELAYH